MESSLHNGGLINTVTECQKKHFFYSIYTMINRACHPQNNFLPVKNKILKKASKDVKKGKNNNLRRKVNKRRRLFQFFLINLLIISSFGFSAVL